MIVKTIARDAALISTANHEPGSVLVAIDAIHRDGLGAWAAVFADGRAATGAGTVERPIDADVRSALLAAEVAGNGPHLCIITNSSSLFAAVEGSGKLVKRDIWREFKNTLPSSWKQPILRREKSPLEQRLHRSTHHLADAAWWATKEGGHASLVAHMGWTVPDSRGGIARLVRSRFGLELRLTTPLPTFLEPALAYAKAALADMATLVAVKPTHLVVRPRAGRAAMSFLILSKLVAELNEATSPESAQDPAAAPRPSSAASPLAPLR